MKCKQSCLWLTLFMASSTVACLYQSADGSVVATALQKSKFVSTPASVKQEQWIEITGLDGDFTAAFPVKPKHIFKEHPEPGQTKNNHIFLAQHNGHTLMVSYMDIILSPGNKYDELQQRKYREVEITKTKRKEGWELLRSTNLPGNGYQHVYFAPPKKSSDLPAYFRAMTFVRGSRVYLITYDASTRLELFGPEARRFFNEFKFKNSKAATLHSPYQ